MLKPHDTRFDIENGSRARIECTFDSRCYKDVKSHPRDYIMQSRITIHASVGIAPQEALLRATLTDWPHLLHLCQYEEPP